MIIDRPSWRVCAASAATGAWLGLDPAELIGRDVDDLPSELGTLLTRATVETDESHLINDSPVGIGSPSVPWWLSVTRAGERLLLEAEPVGDTGPGLDYTFVHSRFEELRAAENVADGATFLARMVRAVTGFGRVMVYRFEADWSGCVIAEDRAASMRSYLGHAFPSGDIPAPAREAYRANRVRLISDIDGATSELLPAAADTGGIPHDLGPATLRAVAPVHLEYLRNMGVRASLSLSIFDGDRLWGLVACHHDTARMVPPNQRRLCKMLVEAYSALLHTFKANEAAVAVAAIEALLTGVTLPHRSRPALLAQLQEALCEVLRCDAVALVERGRTSVWGDGVSEDALAALRTLTSSAPRRSPIVLDAWTLCASHPGLLAVAIPRTLDWIVFLRREWVRSQVWAGDPRKPPWLDANGRINPRKSFTTWTELVTGRSMPWVPADRSAAERVATLLTF